MFQWCNGACCFDHIDRVVTYDLCDGVVIQNGGGSIWWLMLFSSDDINGVGVTVFCRF